MQIKNITINYTFKELDYNPSDKVMDLRKEFYNVFHNEIGFNKELPVFQSLDVPRIQVISEDKKMFFTMSLMNCNVNINTDDMDNDDIVLLINEKMQYFYDVITDIFNVEILYSSIKIEMVEEDNKVITELVDKYHLENINYEDIYVKVVSKIGNDYYLCDILNSSKEINFNIKLPENVTANDNDMFLRSMLISTSEAHINKILLNRIVEINDRLSFNNDPNYLSTKESIRGMVIELKKILKDN